MITLQAGFSRNTARMNSSIYRFVFLLLIFFPHAGHPQDSLTNPDRIYGLDETLFNGVKYDYFPPAGVGGDQYLESPQFIIGSLTIHGRDFTGLSLNYDIVNQQLLLKYYDENGAMQILEVSKAWLTEFRLGSRHFEVLPEKEAPAFYQVIGTGNARFLYFWHKNLEMVSAINRTQGFLYTPAARDSYIEINGKIERFRNRRSLAALFDQARRPEIKKYMRKNRIRPDEASDAEMTALINYISNLK
jgi:hypothetical protein